MFEISEVAQIAFPTKHVVLQKMLKSPRLLPRQARRFTKKVDMEVSEDSNFWSFPCYFDKENMVLSDCKAKYFVAFLHFRFDGIPSGRNVYQAKTECVR